MAWGCRIGSRKHVHCHGLVGYQCRWQTKTSPYMKQCPDSLPRESSRFSKNLLAVNDLTFDSILGSGQTLYQMYRMRTLFLP